MLKKKNAGDDPDPNFQKRSGFNGQRTGVCFLAQGHLSARPGWKHCEEARLAKDA
jgi:hypothetical protein